MPPNKQTTPIKNGTIHLVEDDEALATAISMLVQTEGMQALHHPSGEAFIRHMAQHKSNAAEMTPACILLDVRMGDMSGLEVFDQLNRKYPHLTEPVIFLTGHGDLHMAVDVLKKGAFDFVTKPFISEVLLEQLQRGLAQSASRIDELVFRQETKHLLDDLTDREQLVMTHVVEGLHNKDIAEILGNSVRTIEIHRANVFDKMKVKSAVELVRLLERYASTK
jgi:two-component system response regulator DctR